MTERETSKMRETEKERERERERETKYCISHFCKPFTDERDLEGCGNETMPFTSTAVLPCQCSESVILSANPRVGFLVSKLDNGLVNIMDW